MINELIKLATHLDKRGLRKEADYLDGVIRKMSQEGEYVILTETGKIGSVIPNGTKRVSLDKVPYQL